MDKLSSSIQSGVTGMFEKFRDRLEFQGRSSDTIKTYLIRLNALRLFLIKNYGIDAQRIDHVGDVTGAMLDHWQRELRSAESGRSVEAASVTAARSFFNWAYDMGMIERNPARVLVTVKVPSSPQPHLQWDCVKKIMSAPMPESHRLILDLGFLLQIRRVSIVSMNIGDVSGEPGCYKIRFYNKGGAIREKIIPDELYEALQKYIREHRAGAAPDAPLFVSRTGDRISRRFINRACEKAGASAGVRLTPHAMRRSGLSRVKEVRSASAAQEAALHSNLSTTKRYLYEDAVVANRLFDDMDFPGI